MTIKILCIHGLGGHPDGQWMNDWERSARSVIPSSDLEFESIEYDRIFEKVKISPSEALGSVFDLLWSGISSPFRRPKGIVPDFMRFTAGYVAAWLRDEAFQQETREFIYKRVTEVKPTVILAHSLGSLLTYDAFAHRDVRGKVAEALGATRYVSFGSQIANSFVIGNLTNGRIARLPVKRWVHLYNKMDKVFTAPIALPGVDNFIQINTTFDAEDALNHRAPNYIAHNATAAGLWRTMVRGEDGLPTRFFGSKGLSAPKSKKVTKPVRKALLVGINEYPQPDQRLEGCVNDTYTMSAVLQECGFQAAEIRLCLNERATKDAIMERLDWLLHDARDGDQRLFYFSGHGAEMTAYGANDEPDRHIEALVPYDFDWTLDRAITDEWIYKLYSQLSYNTQFVMIFDCCHARGMHRDGARRARGISPPDDIRHRELRWDPEIEMWVARRLADLAGSNGKKVYYGKDGSTVRLGRSGFVRSQVKSTRISTGNGRTDKGPYLPLIISACKETELSYEYRHGATSYGAFTFCLASILREEENLTFSELVSLTSKRLKQLEYDQTPDVIAPTSVLNMNVPWNTGGATRRKKARGEPGGSTPQLSG